MGDLSKFRKAKLLHVFNTFFDINGSGEIDENDLEIAVKRVCEARGWKPADPEYERTQKTLKTVWNVVTAKADTDNDSQVSVEEWYRAWKEDDKEWSHIFRDLMFLLEDASCDGHIDVDEYIALYKAMGLTEEGSREAFRRFAQADGGEIRKDRFDELWEEYFTSDNPNAPGNFIFGKSDF